MMFSPINAHREMPKKEVEVPKEQPTNPFIVPETTFANLAISAPPKKINHPTAAGHYPTSFPAQYVLPHPYAPSAILATVVVPVTNPFVQPAIYEPTFNPFVEGATTN
jgi:hypothetical protein